MHKRIGRPSTAGFTLFEILIVVMVIALILLIAIPNFLRARDSSRSKACTQNLRQFETAKEQWAITTKAPGWSTPTPAQLVTEFMKGTEDTLPGCPSGGTYALNDLATLPTCSIGNNATAETFDDHLMD